MNYAIQNTNTAHIFYQFYDRYEALARKMQNNELITPSEVEMLSIKNYLNYKIQHMENTLFPNENVYFHISPVPNGGLAIFEGMLKCQSQKNDRNYGKLFFSSSRYPTEYIDAILPINILVFAVDLEGLDFKKRINYYQNLDDWNRKKLLLDFNKTKDFPKETDDIEIMNYITENQFILVSHIEYFTEEDIPFDRLKRIYYIEDFDLKEMYVNCGGDIHSSLDRPFKKYTFEW